MKKIIIPFIIGAILFLSGCSKNTFMDISAFSDYYNKCSPQQNIALDDYYIKDGVYYLVFEKDKILMSLICNEDNLIKEIRLLMAKVDSSGNKTELTPELCSRFTEILCCVLRAYTTLEENECREIVTSMHLDRHSSFKTTGELTATKEDWHTIYFSSELSSVFIISNIYLQPSEKTEKPSSKSAFGNTAYTGRQEALS